METRRGNEFTRGEPWSQKRGRPEMETPCSLGRGERDFKEVRGGGGSGGRRGREVGQKPGEHIAKEANGRECVGKKERVKGIKCCEEG